MVVHNKLSWADTNIRLIISNNACYIHLNDLILYIENFEFKKGAGVI